MKPTILPFAIALFSSLASVVADEKTIVARTNPLRWEPKEISVKAGDVVIWKIDQGFHGVIFSDFDTAKGVLQIEQGSLPIAKQPSFDLPAQGTAVKDSTVPFLVKATIRDIPSGMTEIPFVCTMHPDDMIGRLILKVDASPVDTKANTHASPSPSPEPSK